MFQEYWKEQKKSCVDGKLSHYIHSLLTLLQSHLTHHRFTEGTPVLETLALAGDRVPGIVWRAGREVLLHTGDYSHCLQLYRSFFKVQQWRIESLLETSFFIASHGHFEEAYDCISSQLQVNPFRSHPLCHGYCGVYQYLLHRQQGTIKNEGESGLMAPQTEGDKDTSLHLSLAMKHLKTAQTIGIQLPDGTANTDLFTKLLTELLVEEGETEEALSILIGHCQRHPHRLNPTRFVCTLLRQHYENKQEVRVCYLGDLVKLDESCCEVLEFVKLSMDTESADLPALFCTLLRFLDYPHNATVSTAWDLLHTLQQMWPQYVDCQDWKNRQSWWPRMYSNSLSWGSKQC